MPCDDGDDDAFLVGVAMSIGEVDGIVKRSMLRLYCGVGGCRDSVEDVSESRSPLVVPSSASIKVTIDSESEAALDVEWLPSLSQWTSGIAGSQLLKCTTLLWEGQSGSDEIIGDGRTVAFLEEKKVAACSKSAKGRHGMEWLAWEVE